MCRICGQSKPLSEYSEGQRYFSQCTGDFPPACFSCEAASAKLSDIGKRRPQAPLPHVPRKRCAGCGTDKIRMEFSDRQWRMRVGTGKCTHCCENNHAVGLKPCGACGEVKIQSEYSIRQWGMQVGTGKCVRCREKDNAENVEASGLKQCGTCGEAKDHSEYSVRQWKKKIGTGKCIACWEEDEKKKSAAAILRCCTFCREEKSQDHFSQTQWGKTAAQRTCTTCKEAKAREMVERQAQAKSIDNIAQLVEGERSKGGEAANVALALIANVAAEKTPVDQCLATSKVTPSEEKMTQHFSVSEHSGTVIASATVESIVPGGVGIVNSYSSDVTSEDAVKALRGLAVSAKSQPLGLEMRNELLFKAVQEINVRSPDTVAERAVTVGPNQQTQRVTPNITHRVPEKQTQPEIANQQQTPLSKRCLTCELEKPQTEYSKNQGKKRTGTGRCTPCVIAVPNPAQAAEIAARQVAMASIKTCVRGPQKSTKLILVAAAEEKQLPDIVKESQQKHFCTSKSFGKCEESVLKEVNYLYPEEVERNARSIQNLRLMQCERYDLPGRQYKMEDGEDFKQPLSIKFKKLPPTPKAMEGIYDVLFYYSRNGNVVHSRSTKGTLALKYQQGESPTSAGELNGKIEMHPSLVADIVPFGSNFSFECHNDSCRDKDCHNSTTSLNEAVSIGIKVTEFPSNILREEFDEKNMKCTGTLRVVSERTAGGWNPDECGGRDERRISFGSVVEAEQLAADSRRSFLSRSWIVKQLHLPESVTWLVHDFITYRPMPIFFIEVGDIWVNVDWTVEDRTPCESILIARMRCPTIAKVEAQKIASLS